MKVGAVDPEMRRHEGPARVFEGHDAAVAAIRERRIHPGDVVVIRYEGPAGGPGMQEMLEPTSALAGMGLGAQVALITDGALPPFRSRVKSRWLRRYAHLVTSASTGAVLNDRFGGEDDDG